MATIKPHPPLIQSNEVLLKADGQWLHFAGPHRILQASAREQVIPALRELEELIEVNQWHAAGFLSYEAAPAFDPVYRTRAPEEHRDYPGTARQGRCSERSDEWSPRSVDDTCPGRKCDLPSKSGAQVAGIPYLWFGLYPAPRLVTLPEPAQPKEALSWLPTVDRETYDAAIHQIKEHIAEGRTYQVNYTMRLQAGFKADPWNFFLHLAQTQNNHAAYIDLGRYVICSASPELFFQLDGDTLTCRPMKGTTQRGRTTLEDQEQAQWLKDSEKNRAENVMIVDMIRNDMGRIAKIGSVHVPELFTVERYPTLWQMTSTVRARTDASLSRIFTALFPCASITGAPKVSTMRIISELETTPRRIYTGSLGYIAPNRKATFNVAIRTALIDRTQQTAEYGVGGGIVWDSTDTDEYAEALLKARVLTESLPQFSLLETMLWTPEEGFFLREKHIARLLDSADYFDFSINFRWSSAGSTGAAVSRHSPARAQRTLSDPERSRRGEEVEDEASRDIHLHRAQVPVSRPSLSKEIIESYLNEISSHFTSASAQRVRLLLDKNGNLSSEVKPFQPAEQKNPMKVCLAREPIDSYDVFLFHKTTHRDVYEAARKVADPEYDDVLLYNGRSELTEFTLGNLVVEMDGKLYTPPICCGLLAGTFRAYLLETGQVEEKAIRVEELKDCKKVFLVNSVRKWQSVRVLSRS
jgi:para-aminobenzoate synthetase/4-amino-4-deoxychorismate lyase